MKWLASLLRTILGWLEAAPEPNMPVITAADLRALTDAVYGPPAEGWYAWECRMLREHGSLAFWFDHHRYDDTSYAYPEPSNDDYKANYAASMAVSIQKYGEDMVRTATYWINERTKADPTLRAAHKRQYNPIFWCVLQWCMAGSPDVEVPAWWSLLPDERANGPANTGLNGLNQLAYFQASAMNQTWRPGEYRAVSFGALQ
jgi:hypothetical protein